MNAADESEFVAMPERTLWLAVIERAMQDYLGMGKNLGTKPNKAELHGFFYDAKPAKYNLAYIAEFLFEDTSIMKLIQQRLERLVEARALGNGAEIMRNVHITSAQKMRRSKY